MVKLCNILYIRKIYDKLNVRYILNVKVLKVKYEKISRKINSPPAMWGFETENFFHCEF